jgi:YggT family protein
MILIIVNVIHIISRIIIIAVITDVVLSYFMSPYHTVRMTLDRLVEPLLKPIRRLVPPIQRIDFSPFILIIVIQLIETIFVRLLLGFYSG